MAPCPRVEKKTLKGVQALGINPASGNGIGVVGGDKKTVVPPPILPDFGGLPAIGEPPPQ